MTTEDSIWIGQDGKKHGPYTEVTIRQWLTEGKLAANAMGWRTGMVNWAVLAVMFPPAVVDEPPPLLPTSPSSTQHLVPPFASSGVANAPAVYAASSPNGRDAPSVDSTSYPTPPALHWALVLLFTALTFNIFWIIWSFIQANWVSRIDRQSNAMLLLGLGWCSYIIGYIAYAVAVGGVMTTIGELLIVIWGILYVMANFSMAASMRRAMANHDVKLDMDGATLFFFGTWYLQGQMTWLARLQSTGHRTPNPPRAILWILFLGIPVAILLLVFIGAAIHSKFA